MFCSVQLDECFVLNAALELRWCTLSLGRPLAIDVLLVHSWQSHVFGCEVNVNPHAVLWFKGGNQALTCDQLQHAASRAM